MAIDTRESRQHGYVYYCYYPTRQVPARCIQQHRGTVGFHHHDLAVQLQLQLYLWTTQLDYPRRGFRHPDSKQRRVNCNNDQLRVQHYDCKYQQNLQVWL